MEKVVFCYGCPRSGTTFLTKWLSQGKGYEVKKLPETSNLHPVHSETGLIDLKALYGPSDIYIIRIMRDPIEIARSFYGAKKVVNYDMEETIKSPMPEMKGIARNSDERIIEFIQKEHENSVKQGKAIDLYVRYDELHSKKYRKRIAKAVTRILDFPNRKENFKLLHQWLEDNWMINPVRGGRISYDIGQPTLSKEIIRMLADLKREWFLDQMFAE